MSLKNWFREHIADTDPNPEPGNQRWAEALLDSKAEPKESGR